MTKGSEVAIVSKPDIAVPAGILKVPANLKLTNVQRQRIIEARRERVAWMMAQGYSEMRMAEELGVSPSLVHYDIVEIRQQWQAKTLDNVAEAAITDLARLDFIINGLLPQAEFNPKAADSCMKAIEQRANILGYRQGVTFDIEFYIRQIAESNGYDADKAMEIAAKISATMK
jgi:predicted transcriptional regulator